MRVNRFWLAMIAYVAIAALAWSTLTDEKLRLATFAILALFAVKTFVRRNDVLGPKAEADNED
jgi:membrane protein implicated in regulation of membrane protease activity